MFHMKQFGECGIYKKSPTCDCGAFGDMCLFSVVLKRF